MSSAAHRTRQAPSIPPLRDGDHLTVAEFERRYEAMPELKKAELIEGVVYMPSPVTMEFHASPDGNLMTWLGTYAAYTEGTQAGGDATLKLALGQSQPQPDGLLRILPSYGGQSKTDAKGYVVGGVELTAEVSASTSRFDLFEKLAVYEKNGVLEYIVWRVEDREIDWFMLTAGKYQRLHPSKAGIFKSKAFPGLWLDAAALIAGDMRTVLETLQRGLASPAQRRFVAKLQARQQ